MKLTKASISLIQSRLISKFIYHKKMPKCINDPTRRYKGDEISPLGKGYTAAVEKIGKRMKGIDNKMYVVTKSGKNKRWTRVSDTRPKKNAPMSPMSKRKKRKRKKVKKREEEEYYSDEEYSEDDVDDVEWKLEAAEERCQLSDVFYNETLLVNVAFLAWSYFKDWYRRVRYGEDPYKAYDDVTMVY